jgi:steroid delta-isomerase
MFKELALEYFDAFRNADLLRLRDCFANDVYLRDWNVEVHGKELVISENANILKALGPVAIEVANLYEARRVVIAEIVVTPNGASSIKVVDILEFDQEKKISAIRAYKG